MLVLPFDTRSRFITLPYARSCVSLSIMAVCNAAFHIHAYDTILLEAALQVHTIEPHF